MQYTEKFCIPRRLPQELIARPFFCIVCEQQLNELWETKADILKSVHLVSLEHARFIVQKSCLPIIT